MDIIFEGIFSIAEDVYTDKHPEGVVKYLAYKYKQRAIGIDSGRNRLVFLMGKYVVKLPRDDAGCADNDWEGSVSNMSVDHPEYKEEYKDNVQYARTRLHYYEGIPVLFMEHVECASNAHIETTLGTVPDWTNCVDCGQVGFNSRGKLVAFDYGIR